MTFFTEAETEEWLTPVTRDLKNLDWSDRSYPSTKVWWHAYDYLIHTVPEYPPTELMRLAMITRHERAGANLESCMHDVVCYLYQEVTRKRT